MKKFFVPALAALFIVGMASCKKDYTCTCTVSGVSVSSTIENVSKADAEEACDDSNAAAALLGGSCSLD